MDLSLLVICTGMLIGGVSSIQPIEGIAWIADSAGVLHALDMVTPVITLPFFNAQEQVNISLYTQQNPTTAQRISLGDDSTYPHFNPANPTRVVIHGWTANANRFMMLKEAYMATGLDFNVMMVDWSGPAGAVYPFAKLFTIPVGKYIAQVIDRLRTKKNLNVDSLTIVGHSLGAHVAGIVGSNLKQKAGRIIGLDPAAPLYTFVPKKYRLDKRDAKIVQVIHTNAGIAGWSDSMGTVDFYPNGGTFQRGCGIVSAGCSHNMATLLYAESILKKTLVSTRCKSFSRFKKGGCSRRRHDTMGEWTSRWSRGTFFLRTNAATPFGQGRMKQRTREDEATGST